MISFLVHLTNTLGLENQKIQHVNEINRSLAIGFMPAVQFSGIKHMKNSINHAQPYRMLLMTRKTA